MRKEKAGGMIVGLPKRLGWIAGAAITVLALAPAGATGLRAGRHVGH